ncbi:putative P-type Ca(2+) transporter [Helianthus annuus]|nr:putative P-type Ca(2+) transporter [Helianthus annuus]KAJ0878117.1 putative P-type Ca(2+) transporter [Helianthus annuus]KAJ0882403.1 putative calcium-transporting ATPase [Helianthus annuus]
MRCTSWNQNINPHHLVFLQPIFSVSLTKNCKNNTGIMLYERSTTTFHTLTKAKKRWRLAYFTISFSNTMVSIAKSLISKALPVSEFPTYSVIEIIPQTDVPKVSINIKHNSDHLFYDIDQTQLVNIIQNKDLETLRRADGVKGLAKTLDTHLENGINGQDLDERITVFGSNTYQKPPPKGLFYFVAEAFKDVTILILMGCAVLSLGFGIKEDGIKEGWYVIGLKPWGRRKLRDREIFDSNSA